MLFYLVLMVLSTTLLGLFIRGLFSNPDQVRLKQEGHEFIKKEIEKSERANIFINIIALILLIVFLHFLYRFWNIGVVVAAIIIMIGRLPDLIREIKQGRMVNLNLMERNVFYYITSALPWIALPILYFSL